MIFDALAARNYGVRQIDGHVLQADRFAFAILFQIDMGSARPGPLVADVFRSVAKCRIAKAGFFGYFIHEPVQCAVVSLVAADPVLQTGARSVVALRVESG